MPQPYPWLERTFPFDGPAEMFPDYIERLRGTPARLEERVRGLPLEVLIRRDGETWSIQENAGHLLDLESLPAARLDDFLARRDTLSAWAGNNQASWDADHNAAPIADLLTGFRTERTRLVARLEALPPGEFTRSAMHPRLQKPMRLVDMCEFHAVHDDYHLARISQLIRMFA